MVGSVDPEVRLEHVKKALHKQVIVSTRVGRIELHLALLWHNQFACSLPALLQSFVESTRILKPQGKTE